LLYRMRGTRLRISLGGFAVVFFPILLWGVLELLPLVDRWVMLVQALVLGACLSFDLSRGNWYSGFPEVPPLLIRLMVFIVLASSVTGLAANVLGYVGFARNAIWTMIVLISDIAVFGTVACVVYTLGVITLNLPWANRSHMLPPRRSSLLRWLRRVLIVAVGLVVVVRLLDNSGWYDAANALLQSTLQWRAPVGQDTISVAQALTAAGILLGTWLTVKSIRLLFEEELFPRLRLPLGYPFAVSAITRYLTGFIGVLLAMGVLGVDLTKVSLLAGALGVGIGFGLQNIFNNFASGLILLVERPMNVGDVIELGKLVGIVRRIGIRSSTIRTLQGAEVILPNAELIANPVINWTLSDRLRRMEIDLAVEASGAKVETVVGVLEAAARGSQDVLTDPPPYALFTGFGDGNLNFRLCAWINRYEDESRIASGIRRSVLARFDAEGIQIPDPLRNFNLLSAQSLRERLSLTEPSSS
jgi:potassium efflux system protein